MNRILIIITVLVFGCSPRFQGMKALLEDPENIIIPFDSTFLAFEPVMATFDRMDKKLDDTIPRLVFTGSSSIRMWDSLLVDMDTFPHQVLNRGFGGSTLPEVLYYYDELITPHRADIIILYCGENDITEGYTAEDVMDAFRTFLRLLLSNSPDTQVLYLSMKPSPSRWHLWPEFEKGNKLIAKFIKKLDSPNIRYLDIATPMLNERQDYPTPELFIKDSLHMHRLGYEIWRDLVVPELTDLMECRDEV